MQDVQLLDDFVYNYFNDNVMNDRMTALMKYITLFGSAYVLIPILLVIFFGLKKKIYSLYLSIDLLWAFLLNALMKLFFIRPRPVSTLLDIGGFSFPSAHAMCSVAFYGFLFIIICQNFKSYFFKGTMFLLFLILVTGVCVSRIYLQVHYFSDVVFGVVFGIISLCIFVSILKNMKKVV